MPVVRVKKKSNYTSISNSTLRDSGMTLKAKGLLCMCLSLPSDWVYSVNGLASLCLEGRDCIISALLELEALHYVHRRQTRYENGRLGPCEYLVLEVPVENPDWDDPYTDEPFTDYPTTVYPSAVYPTAEKPITGNRILQNTDKQKTEEYKKRENKDIRHRYGSYQNVLLSDEDYGKLTEEFPRDYPERIERLSEYIASTGKSYKNHLATIRSWARRGSGRSAGYSHERYQFEEGESL